MQRHVGVDDDELARPRGELPGALVGSPVLLRRQLAPDVDVVPEVVLADHLHDPPSLGLLHERSLRAHGERVKVLNTSLRRPIAAARRRLCVSRTSSCHFRTPKFGRTRGRLTRRQKKLGLCAKSLRSGFERYRPETVKEVRRPTDAPFLDRPSTPTTHRPERARVPVPASVNSSRR